MAMNNADCRLGTGPLRSHTPILGDKDSLVDTDTGRVWREESPSSGSGQETNQLFLGEEK